MIIKVKFTELTKTLPVALTNNTQHLPGKFGQIQTVTIGATEYQGEYEVTPKVTEQVIPTKDKLLKEDVIVNSIPFFNVSNTSGGNTVYIGNEV